MTGTTLPTRTEIVTESPRIGNDPAQPSARQSKSATSLDVDLQTEVQWWRGAKGVAVVTLAIQLLMLAWAYRNQLIYGFGDALSHMMIAKRFWDSPNPGISQLGTTWLPLPSVLFAPTTISSWAWRTGLGGSLVTMSCAIVVSVSLFRIGERTGVGRAGGWVAAMVMATNPSWSFLAVTPMTEPFTMALLCLTVVGLLGWANSARPYSAGMTALFCGLPLAAAILTRYEAWSFAALSAPLFAVVCWTRFGWGQRMRNQIYAFIGLPLLAVFWWFIFNWSVFGSPLTFEQGPYSSKALMAPLERLGELYGKGSWISSLNLYGRNLIDVTGTTTLILAFTGLGMTALLWRGLRRELWLGLIGIGVFIIVSLYLGQIAIRLPQSTPPGNLNSRYGVELLPFLAIACAQILRITQFRHFVGRKFAISFIALAIIIVSSSVWFAGLTHGTIPMNAITVQEAISNKQAGIGQRNVAKWLHAHATSGFVIIDENVFAIMPLIGFDLHRVVISSSGAQWRKLLAHPKLVTWVAVQVGNRSDVVWKRYQRDGAFGTIFQPVAAYGDLVVYRRQDYSLLQSRFQLIPLHVAGHR